MSLPRLHCLRGGDPAAVLAAAEAVRTQGGVPLIGDHRWTDEHWAQLSATFDGIECAPDAAWATCTSGSTGAPRVVVRSAASWSDSFDALTELIDLTPDDRVLLPVSLVSSMTVFQAAHARAVGAGILLPVGGTVDDAQLRTATVVHATPLLITDLLARLEAFADAGSPFALRVALVGGDALPTSVRERAAALGVRVVAYAGAAELSFVGVDTDGTGLRPFPGVEVRVDADGALAVRSPFAAIGYAADAPGPFVRGPEGWASVGDRAELHDDGDPRGPRITLLGRRDGAILSAGATVIPADVEAAVLDLPGVAEVAVTGVDTPRVGKLVAAVVVVEPGFDLHAARRALASRLPRSHVPRRWRTVATLPRTLSGKIDRVELQRLAETGSTTVAPPNQEAHAPC